MTGNTSKKKLVVALSVIAVVVVAAIVSVVAVLAAPAQVVNSQVSVSYTVTDVSATVGARYAVANSAIVDAGEITFTADNDGTVEGSLNFIDTDSETPIPENINLTSTNNYVVFEFKFTNNATLAFDATLSAIPTTVTNMVLSYAVKTEAVADFDTITDYTVFYDQVNETKVNNVASVTDEVAGSGVSYIYIKAAIDDLNTGANLDGAFSWNLAAVA